MSPPRTMLTPKQNSPARGGSPRISVVVPTLRRPEALAALLADLARCDPPPHEVVVVDGDRDGSARAPCAEAAIAVRYLAAPPGLTRQRNLGAAAAGGDVVLFVDDDVALAPDTFGLLAEAYRDPAVVGATGRVVGERSQIVPRGSPLRRIIPGGGRQGTFTRYGYPRYVTDVERELDVEHMPGCFLSARRELVLELGFDEALPGYALAEDEDFSCRLAARGRIRYLPAIRVDHKVIPHDYHRSRELSRAAVVNRAYLFRKNFVRTPLARAEFALLVAGLAVHRLAARDLPGARGIVEGAAAALRAGRAPRPAPAGGASGRPVPVAFVSSHARGGGSEQHLGWLLSALDPGWVRLLVSLEEGALPRQARALGYPSVVIATGNRRRDLVRSAWRLRRALVAARPAVVHANGVKAAAVAGLATVATGIPVLWLKHDFSRDGWVAALLARRCAQVVGVSRAVLGTFDRRLARRLRVVHNGVPPLAADRDAGRRAARAAFGAPAERLVALVGRLDPDKGQLELVEVAPAVLAALPGTGFLLVGGSDLASPYAQRLRDRIAALGLGEHVRLAAHRADVRSVIAGCDVLVHASVPPPGARDTEGFPLVVLEAMAAGTPVVAYANGGVPELLGDCGRLVARGDRAGLGAAIVEVLGDRTLWERLSAGGRRRVEERFRLADNVAGLVACYRTLVVG